MPVSYYKYFCYIFTIDHKKQDIT